MSDDYDPAEDSRKCYDVAIAAKRARGDKHYPIPFSQKPATVKLPWPAKELSKIGRPKSTRICSIDGCGKRHEAKGLCDPHYKRLLRHGDAMLGRKRVGEVIICSIPDCGGVVVSRGWCDRHYSSWRRNGSPIPRHQCSAWSADEDAFLKENHGQASIQDIADKMGRTRSSLRARITTLGIAKQELWTAEEEAKLIALYERAGSDGVLHLGRLANEMGRNAGNLSRKARMLGLPVNTHRRTVELRKDRRKYATDEELRAAQSDAAKKRIKENGHPRGMLGKQHGEATRRHLSRTSKAAQLFLSEEEKSRRVVKAMKTKIDRYGTQAPTVRRGTWDAGWRQIGETKKYYRSRWEANYARYLQWLKERGEIADWQHEPETFWFDGIKRGVRSYLPDFRVWENDGRIVLHEVKGWMDSRSRTCLKRMAKYHPQEKIIVIDGRQYRSIRLKVMALIEGWEDATRDSRA